MISKYLRATSSNAGFAAIISIAAGFLPTHAQVVQPEAAQEQLGEILVSARRREESDLAVPVTLTAITPADLAKYGTVDMISVSQEVPGLIMVTGNGGAGGVVSLRGISSSTDNQSIEQAVSFDVDGVQVGSANINRVAQIDLQSISVFKGPQSLLFGKDSPAGVISIRSADPGDHYEASAMVSHEFNGQENIGQLMVSSPVTDTLGVRAVAYIRNMAGFLMDDAPYVTGIAYGPPTEDRRVPQEREAAGRLTLVYKPSDRLKVRVKYTYDKYDSPDSPTDTLERISCPNGAPQVLGLPPSVALGDCRPGTVVYNGVNSPELISYFPDLLKPDQQSSIQQLASVDANYEISPDVTLSSVSGYYYWFEDFECNCTIAPASLLLAANRTYRSQLSQEFRITTAKADWPVNFTAGVYYLNSNFSVDFPLVIDDYVLGLANTPGQGGFGSDNESVIHGYSYAFFGQAIWKILDTLELAGGARWSEEHKHLFDWTNGVADPVAVSARSWTNVSPEATLTWRPTDRLSLYGAYRTGFTAGGFNTGLGATRTDLSYKPETVRGAEIGTKVAMGGVRYNAAVYFYNWSDQQVSFFDPVNLTTQVANAASVRARGLEQDVTWRPSAFKRLELHATVDYNRTYYGSFLAACYTGQTIGAGCNEGPIGGAYTQQNLAGRQIDFAPKWSAAAGLALSSDPIFSSKSILTFTADTNYASSYATLIAQNPAAARPEAWLLNSSIRLAAADESWELALIGVNLTNRILPGSTSEVALTGNPAHTGTNLPGGLADIFGAMDRPRQIRVQLATHFK